MVTDSNFLASIQSEDSKHVWYFQSILEHELFSFVTHLFLCEFVVIGTTLKSGIVYDAQCCKICSDFKSIVVYSSFKYQYLWNTVLPISSEYFSVH